MVTFSSVVTTHHFFTYVSCISTQLYWLLIAFFQDHFHISDPVHYSKTTYTPGK